MKNVKLDGGMSLGYLNDVLKMQGYTPVKSQDELVFVDRISRQAGTDYANYIYDIPSQGLQLTIFANVEPMQPVFHFSFSLVKKEDLEKEKKNYARLCGAAARECKIPFPVALAVGPSNAAHLKGFKPRKPSKSQYWALTNCGIERRKAAIAELLGDNLYYSIGVWDMGQTNSSRLADWLANAN